MPVVLDIQVQDMVSESLAAAVARLHDRRFFARWGQATAKVGRENARAKGGRHFWREIARATHVAEVSDDHALVATDHVAARQKELGGVIRPKEAKALTIPIAPEAEGTRAGEWEMAGHELFVLKGEASKPDSLGVLGYADPDRGFHALFVLRGATRRQEADPFMPRPAQVAALGLEEAFIMLREAQL